VMRRRLFLSGAAVSTFLMLTLNRGVGAHHRDDHRGGPPHTRDTTTTTTPSTTTTTTEPAPTTTTMTSTTTTTAPSTTTTTTTEPPVDNGWSGHVVVNADTVLTHDVTVESLTVAAGATLTLDANRDITIESAGNIVVEGVLVMRPASADIDHVIRFVDVDESVFVGGGMDVVDTDVGLWVMGHGRLDVRGAAKTAWTRDPGVAVGWVAGDELVVTPTAPGATRPDDYSYITVGEPIPTHPTVEIWSGRSLGAEIMNVSRNVRIEGTAEGRAHILIHSHMPQRLEYATIRHMGPRQPVSTWDESVDGRYGLHFHHCHNGSRGTLVEGVVIRDCGAHAYVPHASHGITFRSCISHNTFNDAYWWDPPSSRGSTDDDSDDIVYDACVASLVYPDRSHQGFRLAGFNMKQGARNIARDCVAVGVQGNKNAAGFNWPEGHIGVWEFTGCVAHNNRINGIFTWQNSNLVHVVEDFVCYHNGRAGVEHGAYLTSYIYRNGYLVGNGSGVVLHSNSRQPDFQTFEALWIDGSFDVARHTLEPAGPTIVRGCVIAADPAVRWTNPGRTLEWFELVDNEHPGELHGPLDVLPEGSIVNVDTSPSGVRPTPFTLIDVAPVGFD
jgi:hypothetical protein